MTEETKPKRRGRPKGSGNKLNVKKNLDSTKHTLETLIEDPIKMEVISELLRSQLGTQIVFLNRVALGDPSIEGLSTTNRISASKTLVELSLKFLSDELLESIIKKADGDVKTEADKIQKEIESVSENKANVLIGRFQG